MSNGFVCACANGRQIVIAASAARVLFIAKDLLSKIEALFYRDMRNLLQSAAERAARYLEDIQERRVRPSDEGIRGLGQFREPFPESGADPEEVLSILDDFGSPGTMGCAGPRFFGFVIGGALPAA